MAITGLQALGVGKKYTNQVALGLSEVTIDNEKGIVTFTLNDGSSASWTFPKPANGKDGKNGIDGVDGISVVSVEQPDSRHFRCVFSDGSKSQLITLPVGQGGGGSSSASEIFLSDGTDVETQFGKVQTEIDGLFDVAGNIVYGTVETYADLLLVDTSAFESGIYLYLVKQDENYPKDDDECYSTLYMFLSSQRATWNFIGKLNVSEKMMAEMIATAITSALMNYYTKAELLAMTEEWTFTLEDGSTVTKKVGVFANE